ncbi:YlmC/YmxH family sporulation protein [Natronincola ferrireducens]|uniref:Sporulation protein, YlmC/YmxH family n=1 Tax=Natronincola ferrireducens TaxID=393762 RepID=A0A1G9BNE8_9FIRM|nr:YlmC/YmxH family sporulation protein [Natronincola ferrireducens]SDK41029.1 sporulation protein, YlmC/YmxH family [Natronincola ferrireducens]
MIRASDLTEKEVINITDGRRIGLITDIDVNLEKGKINAIIVPDNEKVFGLFGKELENEITWAEIKKIGIDVILVEVKGNIEPHIGSYMKENDIDNDNTSKYNGFEKNNKK